MRFTKRPFAFPEPLGNAILKTLGLSRGSDASRFAEALKKLWPMLARDRGVAQSDQKHYSFDAKATSAYFLYYLTANCMKVPLILEEMRSFGLEFGENNAKEPLKWLDFGAGPGTVFWGLAWWAERRGVRAQYCGVDQSKNFIQRAQEGASVVSNDFASARFEAQKESKFGEFAERFNPDVISFMNSVGECFADSARREKEIARLLDGLRAASKRDFKPRYLIIIEPATQAASRELLELRESIKSREGVQVMLPCFSARPCGALTGKNDWCHEEAQCEFPSWFNDLGSLAGMRKESVLFSYLVLRVGGEPLSAWPSDAVRMVSQRFEEKGLTACFLCSNSGKARARVLHSKVSDGTGGFLEIVRGEVLERALLDEKGSLEAFEPWPEYEMDATVFPKLQ